MAKGSMNRKFGTLLREKREAKQITLRDFAKQVGVSPTYISMVEQNDAAPPTAERVRKMARVLGEDEDDFVALAGRVSDEMEEAIKKAPAEMASFLRSVSGLSPEQLRKLTERAKKMQDSGES